MRIADALMRVPPLLIELSPLAVTEPGIHFDHATRRRIIPEEIPVELAGCLMRLQIGHQGLHRTQTPVRVERVRHLHMDDLIPR